MMRPSPRTNSNGWSGSTARWPGWRVLILTGATLVVAPRREGRIAAAGPMVTVGIAYAVLSAFGEGAGVVVAKTGMAGLSEPCWRWVRFAALTRFG